MKNVEEVYGEIAVRVESLEEIQKQVIALKSKYESIESEINTLCCTPGFSENMIIMDFTSLMYSLEDPVAEWDSSWDHSSC